MNGIGGSTIAEAKETLTVSEVNAWITYRSKRGSLVAGRRVEQAVARLCLMIAAAHNLKRDTDFEAPYQLIDFLPHEDGFDERQKEFTAEAFFARQLAAERK